MGRAEAMPLALVEPGRRVRLLVVKAGWGIRARLAAMGLIPGVELEVICSSGRGAFIVAVKGGRLMLGRGMAQKIVVV